MTVLSLWAAEGEGKAEPNVSLNLHDSDQDTVSCHSLEREVFSFNTDELAPQEL